MVYLCLWFRGHNQWFLAPLLGGQWWDTVSERKGTVESSCSFHSSEEALRRQAEVRDRVIFKGSSKPTPESFSALLQPCHWFRTKPLTHKLAQNTCSNHKIYEIQWVKAGQKNKNQFSLLILSQLIEIFVSSEKASILYDNCKREFTFNYQFTVYELPEAMLEKEEHVFTSLSEGH